MSHTGLELEVKFAVPGLQPFADRLQALGAVQTQPRLYEINLRFDTAEGSLEAAKRVLRLRQDSQARLTYKGPGQIVDGIHQRVELEFSVSDFDSARLFLEALGYRVSWMYEKYRQAYALGEVTITLDEMPFGGFLEIEGPDAARIQDTAGALGLDWEERILVSYAVLFKRVCQELGLKFRDLSFANFEDISVPPQAFLG
jgi:adenylate cyclase, class 2